MSVIASASTTTLATGGISNAGPQQLVAIRDTLDGHQRERAATGKADEKKARKPGTELSPAEQRRLSELKRTDAEVRAHEQAHIRVGRELITSGPNYSYTYGPDGKRYAVAGEVGIDTSPEQEAQANIDKGRRIQETALAPSDPSPQDQRVAATGKRLEIQGRNDLLAEQREEADSGKDARLSAYTAPDESPGNTLDLYA